MDERISEALDALNVICAAGYREGTPASMIEPQKGLIKRLLLAVDTELAERQGNVVGNDKDMLRRHLVKPCRLACRLALPPRLA